MIRYAKILPLIFLLEACVDRYDLPDNIYVSRLVVSGAITNEPGPYEITLSMSSKPDTAYRPPVWNATVKIFDDAGGMEQLKHAGNGVYVTENINGITGRSYWLTISIGEESYFTEPQELYPAGEIDSFYYQFLENAINPGDKTLPQNALELMVHARGVAQSPNFFRWNWRAIHEMRTYPHLRTRELPRSCSAPPEFPCPPIIVPDPPQCSFEFANDGATCSCCRCWFERKSEAVAVSNNRGVEGIEFRQMLARLPADDYFFIRTFLEVQQMSTGEEGYKFWNLVKRQQEANGSLFQPNNFAIPGNVKNHSQNTPSVLGFFGVYGVTRKSMFINPRDFPVRLSPPGIITETCSGIYPGSVYEMPDFW